MLFIYITMICVRRLGAFQVNISSQHTVMFNLKISRFFKNFHIFKNIVTFNFLQKNMFSLISIAVLWIYCAHPCHKGGQEVWQHLNKKDLTANSYVKSICSFKKIRKGENTNKLHISGNCLV